MGILSAFLIVSLATDRITTVSIVRTLEAKESRNFQSVGASLLAATCDAVIQLSSNLEISQPSPQLNTLLLKSGPPNALQGKLFASLIVGEEDRASFEAFMNSSGARAEALTIDLGDSLSNSVRVQVLHAAGLDADDKTFHILGIIETDPTSHEPPAASAGTLDAVIMSANVAEDTSRMQSISEVGCSSYSASTEVQSYPDIVEEAGRRVWVTAFEDDFPVSACTLSFKRSFCDVRFGRPLTLGLRVQDSEEFNEWLCFTCNSLANQLAVDPRAFQFQTRSRRGVLRNVCFEVNLVLEESGEDDIPTLAKLTLRKVRESRFIVQM